LLLHIRSVHLGSGLRYSGFIRDLPTNLIQQCFCAIMTTWKKQVLVSWIRIQREIGGNHSFFQRQFSLNLDKNAIHCLYFKAAVSLKNAWLPTFFFLDSDRSCKDLLFPHSHNLCKNTSVLGPTVLNIWYSMHSN